MHIREDFKIRKIRSVKILNTCYNVVWHKDTGTCSCTFSPTKDGAHGYLDIGYLYGLNSLPTLAAIIHEVSEVIYHQMYCTLRDSENNCTFILDHTKHTLACFELASVLAQFLK